jgi:NDP-sugar pyrophosphorylase family protein
MRAMVLTAGYGTRLGELTREVPKPMLDAGGRPMVELILRHLVAQGVERVALNLHFMPEAIRSYFGDGSGVGLRELHYSVEDELLGTAGGVRNVADWLTADGDFVVSYGDVVTDQPIAPLIERHRAAMTILVHERPRSNSVAVLSGDGRVTAFLERPTEEERRGIDSDYAFSGIAVCAPEVIDLIPAEGASDFPRDVFPQLVERGALYAVPLTGWRVAVDSPDRLERVREAVRSGRLGATSG